MSPSNDKAVLSGLAKKYLAYANSDRNENNIKRWKKHNSLQTTGFMIMTAQLPWHELSNDEGLRLMCEDPFLRSIEDGLRKQLYQWENYKTDQTLAKFIDFPKSYTTTGIGVIIEEDQLSSDQNNSVKSHAYKDQLADYDDLDKLHKTVITADNDTTKNNHDFLKHVLGDDVPVRAVGESLMFRVWDLLSELRSVTPILMDFVDRPEFLHDTMRRMTDIELDRLRQLEELDLLNPFAEDCHCSGTHCDGFPDDDFKPDKIKTQDCWASGMAQLFSSCSPAMLKEFELAYAAEYYAKVGLVNYGCCEPLHNCIDDIRSAIKNVRKISVSPWADPAIAAQKLGKDVIMARKPNPAFIAGSFGMDEDSIRKELRTTVDTCKSTGTPCELILKDISTVQYEPQRIVRWCELANEEIAR